MDETQKLPGQSAIDNTLPLEQPWFGDFPLLHWMHQRIYGEFSIWVFGDVCSYAHEHLRVSGKDIWS
jgi:hypothetical protein